MLEVNGDEIFESFYLSLQNWWFLSYNDFVECHEKMEFNNHSNSLYIVDSNEGYLHVTKEVFRGNQYCFRLYWFIHNSLEFMAIVLLNQYPINQIPWWTRIFNFFKKIGSHYLARHFHMSLSVEDQVALKFWTICNSTKWNSSYWINQSNVIGNIWKNSIDEWEISYFIIFLGTKIKIDEFEVLQFQDLSNCTTKYCGWYNITISFCTQDLSNCTTISKCWLVHCFCTQDLSNCTTR